MYHDISADVQPRDDYTLCPSSFEHELSFMRDNGFSCVAVKDVFNYAKHRRSLANVRSLMITFDDCYKSFAGCVLQTLRTYGFKATFFISTQCIGKEDAYLNADDIRTLSGAGMSIQSHTHTHAFLDDLSPQKVKEELETSKLMLEEIMRRPVNFFSCPGGRYTRRVIDTARDAGYKGMFTSVPGFTHVCEDGFTIFKRYLVTAYTRHRELAGLIGMNRGTAFGLQSQYYLKQLMKKTMGNQIYQRVWESVRKKRRHG